MSFSSAAALIGRPEPRPPALELLRSPPRFELDTIAASWQRALDTADRALSAAGHQLPPDELARRRHALTEERERIAALLGSVAYSANARHVPWLSPVPIDNGMLGLPAGVTACLFDLDGVLTDSGVLHAAAWAEVFDAFLLELSDKAGRHFIPFDPDRDYGAYLDGRPRLEGVHMFLASRGIRVPDGLAEDPAGAPTAHGLARRKSEAVERGLKRRGVSALPGGRRYLEAAGHAGLGRAVLSASASTLPMLERAGLETLVEARIDADVIHAEHLRSRPAPDLLLAACRRLGVQPHEAVTITHSPAGIAAGRTANVDVIGVGEGARAELLHGCGAERIVPSLYALLDPRLAGLQPA